MLTRIGLALVACSLALGLYDLLTGTDAQPIRPPSAAAQAVATRPPLATIDPTPSPQAHAPAAPRPMSLEAALGQRIVTGYHGATPTASVLQSVHAGRVGGVILFGENLRSVASARAAIRSLRHAAKAGGHPELLLMVDQEGGDVRRLPTLPPRLSPAQMGASSGPGATAEREGRLTGAALRRIGLNVDLAPVADVSMGPASFLGERAFSTSPDVVARAACGFAAGLARERVAGTLKHFPGLGRAPANTDLRPAAVAAGRERIVADLAAYVRCPRAAPLVMISSASYPALGITGPAVLDTRAYRLLDDTGFRGLTITDAFDTPSIRSRNRPARTALRVGVDLLLYGTDEAGARQAFTRLLDDARAGGLSRRELRAKAERIVAFKRRLAIGELEPIE